MIPKSIATHNQLSDSASANHADADTDEERCHQTTCDKGNLPFDSFQVLIESLPHPVYVIDAHDFTIKYANPAAGLSDIDAHQKCHKVIHGLSEPCSRTEHQCPLKIVKETRQPHQVEHIRTGPSGDDQVLHIHTYPILDSDGEVSAVAEYYIDVTDQNRTQRELQTNEKRFQSILDNTPSVIYLKDIEGKYILVNRRYEELFHISRSRIVGMTDYDLFPEEVAGVLRDNDRQVIQSGTAIQTEELVPHDDGVHTYISTKFPLRDPNGEIYGVCGISTDITERKRAEAQREQLVLQLGERVRELTCMYAVTQSIRSLDTIPDILEDIVILIPSGWSYPKIARARIRYNGAEYLSESFQETVWSQTSDIVVHGERRGTVEVHYLEERPAIDEGPFLKEERLLIEHISRAISEAIERKQAEEALRESEEKVRTLYDSSSDAIMLLDEKGFFDCNDATLRLFGCASREEFCSRRPADISPPTQPDGTDSMSYARNNIAVAMKEGNKRFEYLHRRSDGTDFPSEVLLDAMVLGDKKVIQARVYDITERKQAQEALAADAIRQRILIEQSRDGIVVLDLDGSVYESNQRFAEMLGYSPEEVSHLHVWDWEFQFTREQVQEMLRSIDSTGDNFETQHRRKDGTIYDVEISTNGAVFSGEKLIFCVCRDITKRKQAEKALTESQKRLSCILETIEVGVVLVDRETREIVDVNKAAVKMIDASRDQIVGKVCHQFICPADKGKCPIIDLGQEINHSERMLLTAKGENIPVLKTVTSIKLAEKEYLLDTFLDLRDHKRQERVLHDTTARLAAITGSAKDAIIMIDHDGEITFWNPAAEIMFGHSESEAIGQNCHSLLMPEEYRELFSKGFTKFQETGTGPAVGKTVELEAVRKDGSHFPISISISGLRLQNRWHAVGTIRDITTRQQREQQFQQEVSRYTAMIDTVPAMVYLKDIDHRYMVANRSFCDKVGIPLDELIGKTDYDVFPDDVADSYHLSDKAVMDEDRGDTDQEHKIKDAEGVTRWIATTKVPLHDREGLVSGVVGLVQDVTDYHMSREQLVQADKLAAIGTLAAGVAHEINNPIGFISSNLNTMTKYLSRIHNFVEKAAPGQDEDKDSLLEILTDFVDAVDESTEGTTRVKNIVADLKSFSRVDRAEKEHANLNEGLESTLNMVWNELKYHCTVEKDLGDIPELYCIPNQLNQVFMNMLVNAGHATKNTEGRIRIRTWADTENILISIKDNGTGIPTENVGKIFEPFFTTKDVGSGTGLGLSLAYDIVKKHGGTISITTDIGVGTEFVISLPLEGIRDD